MILPSSPSVVVLGAPRCAEHRRFSMEVVQPPKHNAICSGCLSTWDSGNSWWFLGKPGLLRGLARSILSLEGARQCSVKSCCSEKLCTQNAVKSQGEGTLSSTHQQFGGKMSHNNTHLSRRPVWLCCKHCCCTAQNNNVRVMGTEAFVDMMDFES